jgi:hypothetical protein
MNRIGDAEEPSSTTILPPLLGVRIAWALTSQYSSDQIARDSAQDAKQELADLEVKVKSIANTPEGGYVLAALGLIRSTERTLQIILEGRNLNFKEENELRENSQKNILYFSQFSSHLQSILPRLGSMAVVGSAGSITVAQVFEKALAGLPSYVFPLVVTLAVGIGYLLHGLVVVPVVKRLLQKEKIRADYSRNLYYDQYIVRSRRALTSLLNALEGCHTQFFNHPYYRENVNRRILVEEETSGLGSTMCFYVHKHMNEDKITANLWPMCESGEGIRSCELWRKEGEPPRPREGEPPRPRA